MTFFGSRIESPLYPNRCFVTSENNFDGTERYYNIRRFNESYTDVETLGEFNTIYTKSSAVTLAQYIEEGSVAR
jgi:hypothetical protein